MKPGQTTIEIFLSNVIDDLRRDSKAVMSRVHAHAIYVRETEFRNLALKSECFVLNLPTVDENDIEIFPPEINQFYLYFYCAEQIAIDCAYNLESRFESNYSLGNLLTAIKYYLSRDTFIPNI